MGKRIRKRTDAVKVRELVRVLNQLEKCYHLLNAFKMEQYIDTARAEIHAAYLNIWHHRKDLTPRGPLKRSLQCPPAVSNFVFRDNTPGSCLGVVDVSFEKLEIPYRKLGSSEWITIEAEEVTTTMK